MEEVKLHLQKDLELSVLLEKSLNKLKNLKKKLHVSSFEKKRV